MKESRRFSPSLIMSGTLALFVAFATPLLTSCDEKAEFEKSHVFTFGISPVGDVETTELYDAQAIRSELQGLLESELSSLLDGKNVFSITNDEAYTKKQKLKTEFAEFVKHINEQKKYPGTYKFKVTCNNETVCTVEFYTNVLHSVFKVDSKLSKGNAAGQYTITTTVAYKQQQPGLLVLDPDCGEVINQFFINAYDETVGMVSTHSVKNLFTHVTQGKAGHEDFCHTAILPGGEYRAVSNFSKMEYADTTSVTVTESPTVRVDKDDTSLSVYVSTGYPFKPQDYSGLVTMGLKLSKVSATTGNESVVTEMSTSFNLVFGQNRDKVAGTYILPVKKLSELMAGNYILRVTSDYASTNLEYRFTK